MRLSTTVKVKDVDQLNEKTSLNGDEKIPVSAKEYITPHQLVDFISPQVDNVDHATYADNATNANHANNSDQWDGHRFADLLNQPVRRGDDVEFAEVVAGEFCTPEYAEGFSGFGSCIKQGAAEFDSLRLRRFLDVPELRYNRVDVSVGDDWSAPGGGVIERVDAELCIVTLKLEQGEVGAVAVGDICMGIFHSQTPSDNAIADVDDSRGNRYFAGFATSYFTVEEVMGSRNEQFRYSLRPVSGVYPKPFAPQVAMAFVSYGSFTDPTRRNSRYATRTYERYLRGVDTWEIGADNIAAQFGDLSNLAVFGLNMAGYSAYLDNIYVQGLIRSMDGQFVLDTRTKSLLMSHPDSGMGLAFNPQKGLMLGKVYDPVTGKFDESYDIELISNTASEADRKAVEASNAIHATDGAVAGLKNFTDTAFADGVVSRADAASIEKYKNIVTESKKRADTSCAVVLGNALLGGSAKTNLLAAKSTFDTSIADLLSAISTASVDGIATAAEKAEVDRKYTAFTSDYGRLNTCLEEADKYISTAINTTAQEAFRLSDELRQTLSNLTETILPDLQNQIDGSIMSHTGSYVPSLTNAPADGWTADTERKRHLGDYFDRTIAGAGSAQTTTERYKFMLQNGACQWVRVADDGAAQALSEARNALGLAGTKAAVSFGDSTPVVPYHIDDVWIKTSGVILICNADREAGSIASPADWQVVNDTAVRLRMLASDSVITKEEKPALRNRLAQIEKEYTAYAADATTYGVSISALSAAKTALVNFLNGTVVVGQQTDTELTAAQRTQYNDLFGKYDSEVLRFSNRVSDSLAQGKVDQMQIGGVNLILKSVVESPPPFANFIFWKFLSRPLIVGQTYVLSIPDGLDECTELSVAPGYGLGSNGQHIQPNVPFIARHAHATIFAIGDNAVNTNKRVQLEQGNKPTDWSPAPEDVTADIAAVQTNVDNTNTAVDNLNTYVDGAFKDGVIDTSEAKAIAEQIKAINETKATADSSYSTVYSNAMLTGAFKTNLASAKTGLDSKRAALITAINNIVTNKKVTAALRTAYEAAHAAYTTSYGTFSTRLAEATKSIEDAIKAQTEKLVAEVQIGGVNLAPGVKEVTIPASAGNQFNFKSFVLDEQLKGGDQLTLHIANIEMVTGASDLFLVAIFNKALAVNFAENSKLKVGENTWTFTIPSGTSLQDMRLLLYAGSAGATAGNSVKYSGVTLVRGNKPMLSWSPSVSEVKAEIDGVRLTGEQSKKKLSDWASDDIVSPVEKFSLRLLKSNVDAEYAQVLAEAKLYAVSTASFTTAYNLAAAAFTKYTAATPAEIPIDKVANDYPNIAAYYNARKTIGEVIAKASDTKFLNDAFKNISTDISGGVVLGGFMGVKNSAGKIVAGVAGKNFIKGTDFTTNDNSCPMIFAGNTGALVDANNANTRIYPDGTIETKALAAKYGCKLGDFELTSSEGDSKMFPGLWYNENNFNLGSSNIFSFWSKGRMTFHGESNYESMDFTVLVSKPSHSIVPAPYDERSPVISVSSTSNSIGGISVDCTDAPAMMIHDGYIAGFRRADKVITANYAVSDLDCRLFCDNTSSITLTLPSSPKMGQEYELYIFDRGAVYVNGNGKQIYRMGVSTSTSHGFMPGTFCGIVRLAYSSKFGRWYMTLETGTGA